MSFTEFSPVLRVLPHLEIKINLKITFFIRVMQALWNQQDRWPYG